MRRNRPLESVKVSSVVLSTVTRARSTGSPVRRWVTRPSMIPVAAGCATAETAKKGSASDVKRTLGVSRQAIAKTEQSEDFLGAWTVGRRAWRSRSERAERLQRGELF